jgi:S1-C subfamily serine protease
MQSPLSMTRKASMLPTHLILAVLVMSVACHSARAQDDIKPQTLEIPKSGVAQPFPADAAVPSGTADPTLFSSIVSEEALVTQFKEAIPHTRGPQDISLFREAAPSVVLILAKDKLGSGSLLQDNVILTNLHVVKESGDVTIVFKPATPNGKATADEVVIADVVKIDVQRDLALVRPRSLPNYAVRPLQISSQDIEVGADVRAIGHPKGKDWTYTKGIVSSIRPDFEWSSGPGDSHRATVIQTQTPINPGNSGGPLLSDDGKIVGVNSFIEKDAEGLNFAVAAKEISYFLRNKANGLETRNTCDQAKPIFEGRNLKNTAFLRMISLRCDDKTDITIVVPDDEAEPVYAQVDLKRRGKPEGVVFDMGRSGKWNNSYWDPKLDDTFPLRGLHPDGKLMPTTFEPRCGQRRPLTNFKCA